MPFPQLALLAALVALPLGNDLRKSEASVVQAAKPQRLAAPAKPAAPARPVEPATANYLSTRLNGKPLPYADRASDEGGVQYLIEFDELVLSLRVNHEFRASLRYRQTLASKGDRISRDPIQKMTVYGTWAVINGGLHFTPDPTRGGSGLNMLTGTFAGPRIEVPFDYRNGSVTRRASVVVVRNDNII
jgi:hypothetical protein